MGVVVMDMLILLQWLAGVCSGAAVQPTACLESLVRVLHAFMRTTCTAACGGGCIRCYASVHCWC